MDNSPPPGADHAVAEDDPYSDEDISEYPDWWRESIEEHRAFGLRPYRPPRFSDGVVLPPVVERLEERHSVEIDISVVNPDDGGQWRLSVDGVEVADLKRARTAEGYTRYGLSSTEFERLVRDATEG